jgi:hypothetical protein
VTGKIIRHNILGRRIVVRSREGTEVELGIEDLKTNRSN